MNTGGGVGADGQVQDFERLARQYWAAWASVLGGGPSGTGQAATHAWQDAIDGWMRSVQGDSAGVDDALQRFNAQARGWYASMQEVAATFAGRDHVAADIVQAWKEALGAAGGNPFADLQRSMGGSAGLGQWIEGAAPWLAAVRGEGLSWLRLPALGVGREHQERLQALAAAVAEYEQASSTYNLLMLEAAQRAFTLFETKLAARTEPDHRVETARALFDLWIDAAEEAYAEIALSPQFRVAYGALVNAQMRVRAGLQAQVEQVCAALGMPTRTEVDAAHQKIVELERALRRLRDEVEGGSGAVSPRSGPGPAAGARSSAGTSAEQVGASKGAAPSRPTSRAGSAGPAPSSAAMPAKRASGANAAGPSRTVAKTAPKKAAVKKAAVKKAAVKKAAVKKTAVKKAAVKKAAVKKPMAKKATARKAGPVARSPARPEAPRRGVSPAKRPAGKRASRPSVSAPVGASRAARGGSSNHIPIPDAPLPPDPAPAVKRGGR